MSIQPKSKTKKQGPVKTGPRLIPEAICVFKKAFVFLMTNMAV